MQKSLVNPIMTIEYLTTAKEGKHFDRKSAQKKPSDLACLVSAFANAEGGTIAIGIEDKNCIIERFNGCAAGRINAFISMPKDCCQPMPQYREEILDVVNFRGEQDHVLLLHIEPSVDQIIRTSNDSTYLRIGDQTKEIKGDDLRNLEYSKNVRHYEDELNYDASVEDLDKDLLKQYKSHIGADDLDTYQVLRARGFLKRKDGREYLTNAAVLLFAQNIMQFYTNCRVRFIRYEGNSMQVGANINIIKDISLDEPILRLVEKTKECVKSQLREFTVLDKKSGKFGMVPEYPEFAWFEGIVNAICHRNYAMAGAYIKVSMFDDRLEIVSPGGLPNIVTLANIKETRYSRNTKIARVMTEFGWVRELNEGVKRIYKEMEEFFLEDPEYSEDTNGVKLVLKNNIVMRRMRQKEQAIRIVGNYNWLEFDDLEREIITYLSAKKCLTTIEIANYARVSQTTIRTRLAKLINKDIIKRNGTRNSPRQTYSLNIL